MLALALGLSWVDKRVALALALIAAFAAYGRGIRFGLTVGAIFLASALFLHPFGDAIFSDRNFFGIKWVLNDSSSGYHLLIHNGTLHGIQAQHLNRLREPLAYFGRRGPLGQAMEAISTQIRSGRVTVVGLGAGAVACYAQPNQKWSFYEIDPQVVEIAEDPNYFSFLSLCTPSARMVLGDARLNLAAEVPFPNAAIILDAYSADTVPTHLLTIEALDLYLRNLAPNGVLLFNVSNQYFDLRPVLGNLAASRRLVAFYQFDSISERNALRDGRFGSRWVVMARRKSALSTIPSDRRWRPLLADPRIPLWTDDYSSLVRVLSILVD